MVRLSFDRRTAAGPKACGQRSRCRSV